MLINLKPWLMRASLTTKLNLQTVATRTGITFHIFYSDRFIISNHNMQSICCVLDSFIYLSAYLVQPITTTRWTIK